MTSSIRANRRRERSRFEIDIAHGQHRIVRHAAQAGLGRPGHGPCRRRAEDRIHQTDIHRRATTHEQCVLVHRDDVAFGLGNLTFVLGVCAPEIQVGK